ncbi:hypothetical protein L1887_52056 [Cichorium endivia]|nr:hypothetical protein L1887_52056 [Cichorium endivia]
MTSSEAYDCQAMMNAVAARGKMGACRSSGDGAGKGGGERKRWWRCAREIATRAATAGRLPLSSGCSAAVLLCCCVAVLLCREAAEPCQKSAVAYFNLTLLRKKSAVESSCHFIGAVPRMLSLKPREGGGRGRMKRSGICI